jgi:hypothetical protein
MVGNCHKTQKRSLETRAWVVALPPKATNPQSATYLKVFCTSLSVIAHLAFFANRGNGKSKELPTSFLGLALAKGMARYQDINPDYRSLSKSLSRQLDNCHIAIRSL